MENLYEAPKSNLTVENEEELEYAGFWIRTLAALIDTVLLILLTFPLLYLIYGEAYLESEAMIVGHWDFIISYVFPAVAVILFWLYKSATPGKMMLGLKIISLKDSKKLTIGQSIGRYLGYYPQRWF